jgi:ribosomal protein S18 acetylase RimI-like enzyme
MATAILDRGERIVAERTTDRELLRAFLERDRRFAAYGICDLDDREFPRTRWGVARSGGEVVAAVCEYDGPSPQPLLLMGRPDGLAAILESAVRPWLAYAALLPEQVGAMQRRYQLQAGSAMVRMWVDRERFAPVEGIAVTRLGGVDAPDLNRLYRLGFGAWLPAGQVRDGVYYGIRVGGRLVAAAGTHVVSPGSRIAVVGNVLTDPMHRGRGYATAVTSAVTAELLAFCDDVVLNVRADNPPALAAYRHLGYGEHVRFEERLVRRLGTPWSELFAAVRRRLFESGKEPQPR